MGFSFNIKIKINIFGLYKINLQIGYGFFGKMEQLTLQEFLPSYLVNLTTDELYQRSIKLNEKLKNCSICPRNCSCDRTSGKYGVCRSSSQVIISSYGPHYGEEPVLVGTRGSGTIFFTNCNLKCQYCQNYDISQLKMGTEISIRKLSDCMLYLQNSGCHNINFVTPTHFVPQIVEALTIAIQKGLKLPLVYNCGGYESVETLELVDGIIDIYMPDVKYSNDEYSTKYSGAPNYWSLVRKVLIEMHKQVGDLTINSSGIAKRGLIIRHLILPNGIAGSKKILDFIANEISINSYVNLMPQYRPSYNAFRHKLLNRYITKNEYYEVIDYAVKLGLTRGLEY